MELWLAACETEENWHAMAPIGRKFSRKERPDKARAERGVRGAWVRDIGLNVGHTIPSSDAAIETRKKLNAKLSDVKTTSYDDKEVESEKCRKAKNGR